MQGISISSSSSSSSASYSYLFSLFLSLFIPLSLRACLCPLLLVYLVVILGRLSPAAVAAASPFCDCFCAFLSVRKSLKVQFFAFDAHLRLNGVAFAPMSSPALRHFRVPTNHSLRFRVHCILYSYNDRVYSAAM